MPIPIRSLLRRRAVATAVVVFPLLTGIAAVGTTVAHAQDQTVASVADVVVTSTLDDGSPGTLRAAYAAANSMGGTVTIGITAVGTIQLTSNLPDLGQNTTIIGAGTGQTVIDTAGFRFLGSNATADFVATDLTLTGSHGGGAGETVRRSGGTTTLQRVEITGNDGGGGVIFISNSSVVSLIDSTVHDNSGPILSSDWGNTPGGDTAAAPYADSVYSTRIYVTNTTFTANSGCVISAERFVTVTGSTFSGGSTLCLSGLNRKTIRGSTFAGPGGVAISLDKNANWDVPVIIDDVDISGYSVGIAGAYTTVTITGSTICDNGTAYTDWDAAQTIDISGDSQVGASCPPPATTTTTTAATTTTEPATTTTAPTTTTTTAPTTTSGPAPSTSSTPTSTTPTSTTPTSVAPTSTTTFPSPLGPLDVTPVTGLPGNLASSVDRNGSVVPVEVRIVDGRHVLSSAGTTLVVSGSGPSLPGTSLALTPGGEAVAEGSGFLPGSAVQAWMFSTPSAVGQAVVGSDGSFRLAGTVPSTLTAGSHTLVVSGVRSDGTAQAVGLGVTLTGEVTTTVPRTGALPVTGGSPRPLLVFGFALLCVGAMLTVRARRTPLQPID